MGDFRSWTHKRLSGKPIFLRRNYYLINYGHIIFSKRYIVISYHEIKETKENNVIRLKRKHYRSPKWYKKYKIITHLFVDFKKVNVHQMGGVKLVKERGKKQNHYF